MAVAAYASVLSLLHVLDQIQHPVRCRLLPNMKQIETLQEKVRYLQEFLEDSQRKTDQIQDLLRQIAEVAYEAQFNIESHVVDQLCEEHEEKIYMGLSLLFSEDTTDDHAADQLHGGSESTTDNGLSSFCQDIDKVIEKIDSIKKELLTMVKEGKAVQEQRPIVSVRAGSSTLPSRGKNTHVVGFNEHLVRIMEELTSQKPNLHIIPITGMGGIGKTTLARLTFENKSVLEHFDVPVWFTISQEYTVHEILLGILRDVGFTSDLKSETLAKLKEKLHKHLFGKRYMIVMDDTWSIEAWDDLKLSFPDYGNGSRIIVTTGLSNVAISLGSSTPYLMNFLDEDKSWSLFCEKAFAQQNWPPELEEPGEKIAKSCRGLPLAIVVIGGFLAKSNMKRDYWELVAENVNFYANSEHDEQCLKILTLSYQHLPIHLKPCFLYMRVFPEDHEIRVSILIKLWIAEGFLKPLKTKNLEEVADEYLKDLIDRNLILIRERGRTGKIKTCGIHDLLRDLCMKESHREHFFCVPKVQNIKEGQRWQKKKVASCVVMDTNKKGLTSLKSFLAWNHHHLSALGCAMPVELCFHILIG